MNNSPFPWNDDLHFDKYTDHTPIKPEYPHVLMHRLPFICTLRLAPNTHNDPDEPQVEKFDNIHLSVQRLYELYSEQVSLQNYFYG